VSHQAGFVGSAAATAGLEGAASPEQVQAMFQGLDPATGEVRCAPLPRADPRSKLAAGPLLEALKTRAAERGVENLEELGRSKALKGDVRSVQAACRLGGARRVKVETVERLCRKVLDVDPRELYGEEFEGAWQHRGKRVNERVQAFDHCFSSPKSVSLLAAGSGPQVRRLLADGRAEALTVAIGFLEQHGIGIRRDHNGIDRHQAVGGLVAVAFEHRMSRSGDPNSHTHVLVQNAAQGPDGRWTALDSDRLYAHLMAADHLYLVAERAALSERLGVRWGPVDERSGAAEIQGLDDRTLIERFSKALGADRPVAGQPWPVRDQGVQRGGGGDQGAQGPQRVGTERLPAVGARAGGAGGRRAAAGRGLLGWTGPSSDSDRVGRRAGRAV
jgi:hypothetical protein